ncbi:MAG: DUF362 domain-containing protein [Dehalococcoidia bacterium]|jgi:hypothetical protein
MYDAADFVFEPPAVISRARRVLIKPSAASPSPYPVSTSQQMLSAIIEGIRQVSDADVLILEGTPDGEPVFPIYQKLGYDFPRVLTLDVKDCVWVEVDNPLPKPLIVPTFWIPNVILSCDYLITVSPLKVIQGQGFLSIANLLSVLPGSKYGPGNPWGWEELYELGIEQVLADLYFTLPFDLGVIEANQKLIGEEDPTRGYPDSCGRIFVGEPYEVDREAARAAGVKTDYLDLIREARVGLEE